MPILNKACGVCGELETGSKIIAIIHLIGSLIMSLAWLIVVWSIFAVADTLHASLGEYDAMKEELIKTHGDQFGAQNDAAMSATDLMMKFAKAYIIVFQVIVVVVELIYIGQVVACSALIHGIKKERRGLALPFLAVQAFCLVFGFIMIIFVACTPFAGNMVQFFVSNIISIAIGTWCWVVVYSYYQMMGERPIRGDMMMK